MVSDLQRRHWLLRTMSLGDESTPRLDQGQQLVDTDTIFQPAIVDLDLGGVEPVLKQEDAVIVRPLPADHAQLFRQALDQRNQPQVDVPGNGLGDAGIGIVIGTPLPADRDTSCYA
jgi:hypothetical protein